MSDFIGSHLEFFSDLTWSGDVVICGSIGPSISIEKEIGREGREEKRFGGDREGVEGTVSFIQAGVSTH